MNLIEHLDLAEVTTDVKPFIFISYSRKNGDFVDWLARSLEGLGFDCWVDRHDLEAGATWREEISQSIRRCQAFVLVVSTDSTHSSIVSQELSLAEFHGRPIIPLMYEVCELPPGIDLQIQHLQWVNFVGESYDDAMVRLDTAIQAVTSTPQNGLARIQRSLKAWVPWISAFYICSGIYYSVALLLFLGGWHDAFNFEQLNDLGRLSVFDQALWASISLLHIAGAVYLWRLRRLVVGLFIADWCAYTVYVAYAFLAIQPGASPTATLMSYGIFSLVVWYVYQLQKANLLSPPHASRVGNEKAREVPRVTRVSSLEEPTGNTNISTVMGKLT